MCCSPEVQWEQTATSFILFIRVERWSGIVAPLSTVEILGRLKTADAARTNEKHLRTVQRAVKKWRAQYARRIIAEGAAIIAPNTEITQLAMPERYAKAAGHHRAVADVGF